MSHHGEDLAFVEDGVDAALGEDACLAHLFHGVLTSLFLLLHTPDLAEATFADDIVELEVRLVHSHYSLCRTAYLQPAPSPSLTCHCNVPY